MFVGGLRGFVADVTCNIIILVKLKVQGKINTKL